MPRRFLPLLAAVGALSLLPLTESMPAHAAPPKQPNILFIMVDDLGKDWIGCYGADNIKTPHIDRLAKSGMKFHNVYSMPQCTPTRVSLLTGQYPWRTGWVNHWDVPRWGKAYFDWAHYTTFAAPLRHAGYRTAIAGKWQINDFRSEPRALEKHGFETWCMWTGGESNNPTSNARYWDPYIHVGETSRTYQGEYGPDIYCDFLIEFMRANRDQPQLLYFPMCLTHSPLVTTPAEPQVQGKERHAAMVRYTDRLVGRLLDTLEELGLRQRTYVFFTTDNGTAGNVLGTIGGQRPRGGKASKFEGGVCQPFLVSCPGTIPAGSETAALVDFTDLLPTFIELAGAKLPDHTIDGRSFAPLLLGEKRDSPREWIMALGHGPAKVDNQGVRGQNDYTPRVIRDKQYKVWVDANRRISQLYDLQADPLERNNLLKSEQPEHQAALEKFAAVVASTPEQDARPQYRPRGS